MCELEQSSPVPVPSILISVQRGLTQSLVLPGLCLTNPLVPGVVWGWLGLRAQSTNRRDFSGRKHLSTGLDGLELGTPAWNCLPCPWQYPGGKHTLGIMKGVLMAVPAGSQGRQMGVQGVGWALAEPLGPGEGAQGTAGSRASPFLLAPWLPWKPTPVWDGLAVCCLSPPPNPYVEVGGGPGGVWGRGLPHPPPRASFFAENLSSL